LTFREGLKWDEMCITSHLKDFYQPWSGGRDNCYGFGPHGELIKAEKLSNRWTGVSF
jgi:hypothetical protein